jgi:hypothetical protein
VSHCDVSILTNIGISSSGLTAVTGLSEQSKSWSSAFPVSEDAILVTQWPGVLLSNAGLHKHCKDACGCFSLILAWQQGILSWHIVCNTRCWLTSLWGFAARVLPETSYLFHLKFYIPSYVTGQEDIWGFTFWTLHILWTCMRACVWMCRVRACACANWLQMIFM